MDPEERERARLIAVDITANMEADSGDATVASLLARAFLDQENEITMAYDAIFYAVPAAVPLHKKIQTLIEETDLMRTIVDAAEKWRKNGHDKGAALIKAVDAYMTLSGHPADVPNKDFGEF